jgi:hypothetical protein
MLRKSDVMCFLGGKNSFINDVNLESWQYNGYK